MADRNFPLLEFISNSPDYRQALADNASIRAVIQARTARISNAQSTCTADTQCLLGAWLWKEDEIATVGKALAGDRKLGSLPRLHLRPSGMFERYASLGDAALTEQAWRTTVEGINHIIRTYGLGVAPRYPKIDSIAFDTNDTAFVGLVREALTLLKADMAEEIGGLLASERLALDLLYVNERENAGFFAQLDTRDNARAHEAVARTDWNEFPYALILVLGDGPDDAGKQLGSFGKLRLQHAATLYRRGMAPFLIVSGGNVHPARTPINEAQEMKRELMGRYGIPEAAIIMEPYARHTTTNFRNAARLMIRYGIPLDKDALVTTSINHSRYAEGPLIQEKAMTELGYSPMRIVRRLGPFDLVFRADAASMHRDPSDPLDP